MKTLILSALLQCPQLAGEYHCLLRGDQYSLLKVEQKNVSENLVQYSFDYIAIPGEPDIIHASALGELDEMGWVTSCSSDNRLRSVFYDGSMLSEFYLTKDKALIRAFNGRVVQTCYRKE